MLYRSLTKKKNVIQHDQFSSRILCCSKQTADPLPHVESAKTSSCQGRSKIQEEPNTIMSCKSCIVWCMCYILCALGYVPSRSTQFKSIHPLVRLTVAFMLTTNHRAGFGNVDPFNRPLCVSMRVFPSQIKSDTPPTNKLVWFMNPGSTYYQNPSGRHLAVAQKTGNTKRNPGKWKARTKTCGLPLLFNFEPHPFNGRGTLAAAAGSAALCGALSPAGSRASGFWGGGVRVRGVASGRVGSGDGSK